MRKTVERQSTDEIIDNILKKFDGKKIIVLAPLIKGRKDIMKTF
jgi:excinuclease ABC subunit A